MGLVALGVIGSIWVKVRLEAGAALERARTHQANGDTDLAIVVYRQTIRWYSPFSGPVATAVDELEAFAASLEAAGDPNQALVAYRALRSAIYGIRGLTDPFAERLEPVNGRIAALMAAQEGAEAGSSAHAERLAHHAALLSVDHAPALGWSLLAVLGFLAWVGALFGLAWRGFDDASGALLPGAAAPWAVGIVVTSALWMTGLALA